MKNFGIFIFSYPEVQELQAIYTAYLLPVFQRLMPKSDWNEAKVQKLASSMVNVYEQVREKFKQDEQSHYLFTPRDLTHWTLGLLRYDLGAK